MCILNITGKEFLFTDKIKVLLKSYLVAFIFYHYLSISCQRKLDGILVYDESEYFADSYINLLYHFKHLDAMMGG